MDFLVLTRSGMDNSWKDGLPDGAVRPASPKELPTGYEMGYMATVPLAETQITCLTCWNAFAKGGELLIQEVKDINPCCARQYIVVNCAGWAPGAFCDESVYPIRRQVVKVRKKGSVQSMVDSMDKVAGIHHRTQRLHCWAALTTITTTTGNLPNRIPNTILARCRQLEQRLGAPVVLPVPWRACRPKRPPSAAKRRKGGMFSQLRPRRRGFYCILGLRR